MQFEDVINSRYSVRKYSDRPVEEEKLLKILEAGRLAPTAKNMQGQHVYVVRSPEMRKKFNKDWAMHFDAPIVLIIAMKKELEWISHFSKLNRGETDAAIVTDEMMLQAHALGLGTCWVGWFDPVKVKELSLSSGSMFFLKDTQPDEPSAIAQKVYDIYNNRSYAVIHVQGAFPPAYIAEFPSALAALVNGEVDAQGFVDYLQEAIDMA